ncbi:MAG: extracellular solute-binding protein [Candidatus Shapirobacteria bacterium]|nr:extracellular solute-binding protein [Candidatus Shapirobacteria bacterium]
MELEEIKSPLPPREINNEKIVDEKPMTESVEARTTLPTEVIPIDKQPIKKGISQKKMLIIGGIVVGLVLIISLIFFLLSGKNKSGIVTLNYWGLWEEENVMNGVIAEFEAKNPNIKINYKRNQISDYRSRLIGRLTKTGDNNVETVDVFRIHNTWLPMFRDYLANVPVKTVENIGLESDFFDIYKTDLKENGNYLSIPLMYDGLALFYNKDLIETAKVELPKTWWDLEETAIKLTNKDSNGKIKVSGVALGTTDNVDSWSDIVGLMMKQNGIDLSKNNSSNYENLKDVLSFYTSFVSKDKVWDETMPNSTQLFANGKLAFYIGPSWRIFDIQNLNKNLNFGITAMPQLPVLGENGTSTDETKLTNINWATYWTEGVNSKSKYQPEAWKFLEYLSSKEGLMTMYAASSQVRDFGEIYPRKSMMAKVSDNWKITPFVTGADKATSWYLASETDDSGVNSDMQKYFGDAVNSILNGGDLEGIMETLKNGVSQTQNKYKLKR